jgi:hypothetical protein
VTEEPQQQLTATFAVFIKEKRDLIEKKGVASKNKLIDLEGSHSNSLCFFGYHHN